MLDGCSGWLLEHKLNEYKYAYGLEKSPSPSTFTARKKLMGMCSCKKKLWHDFPDMHLNKSNGPLSIIQIESEFIREKKTISWSE